MSVAGQDPLYLPGNSEAVAALREAAQTIWDYHHMEHVLNEADLIWVLGSHDLRVAERAADLYHQGFAPRVLMSGGLGNFTRGVFDQPEADLLAAVARDRGVPAEKILIENQSTNTGENVALSRKILADAGLPVRTAIAVQKPYMERRTFATIRRQWPELTVSVTSPQLDLEGYCSAAIPLVRVIEIMVGDLQRIIEYPALGFQIPQEVPEAVYAAYQFLIRSGFDAHLRTTE